MPRSRLCARSSRIAEFLQKAPAAGRREGADAPLRARGEAGGARAVVITFSDGSLDPNRLQRSREPRLPALDPSSNALARDLIDMYFEEEQELRPTVIAAEAQPGAYGRNGRSWAAPAGRGLYLTILRRAAEGEPLSVVPIAFARWIRGRAAPGNRSAGRAEVAQRPLRRAAQARRRPHRVADAGRARPAWPSGVGINVLGRAEALGVPNATTIEEETGRRIALARPPAGAPRAARRASSPRPRWERGDPRPGSSPRSIGPATCSRCAATTRRCAANTSGWIRPDSCGSRRPPARRSVAAGEVAQVVRRPHAALLAVDVGNTNTVLGLWRGDELARHWRLTTRRDATADEIALSIRGLFAAGPAPEELAPMRVIVASVVPSLQVSAAPGPPAGPRAGAAVRRAGRQDGNADPLRHAAGGRRRPHRQRRGGVRPRWAGPCIVVDFGTATTFDVVTAKGRVRRRRHRARDRDLGRGALREGRPPLARRDPAARARRRQDDGRLDPVRPLLRLPLARRRHDRSHRRRDRREAAA